MRYSGFVDEVYTSTEEVPWHSEDVGFVSINDGFSPISTAYWFSEMSSSDVFKIIDFDTDIIIYTNEETITKINITSGLLSYILKYNNVSY
jgi:hypothetical protein